jgi:hypothetical protein
MKGAPAAARRGVRERAANGLTRAEDEWQARITLLAAQSVDDGVEETEHEVADAKLRGHSWRKEDRMKPERREEHRTLLLHVEEGTVAPALLAGGHDLATHPEAIGSWTERHEVVDENGPQPGCGVEQGMQLATRSVGGCQAWSERERGGTP